MIVHGDRSPSLNIYDQARGYTNYNNVVGVEKRMFNNAMSQVQVMKNVRIRSYKNKTMSVT